MSSVGEFIRGKSEKATVTNQVGAFIRLQSNNSLAKSLVNKGTTTSEAAQGLKASIERADAVLNVVANAFADRQPGAIIRKAREAALVATSVQKAGPIGAYRPARIIGVK